MHVLLSRKQINSLNNNKGIQLSHRQLIEPNQKETYGRGLLTHHASRIEKAIQKRTGVRLSRDHFDNGEYQGEGFFDDVKKAAKSVNKMALKADVGGIIENSKKYVTPILKQSIEEALIAGGADPVYAASVAGSAAGAVNKVDFSKSLKGQKTKALTGAVQGGVKDGMAAKKKAAKAAASTYEGEGFIDDIKGAYKKVNKLALKADVGGVIEKSKKYVTPILKQSIEAGLIAAGTDPVVASAMAGSAAGAIDKVDFSVSLKGQGKNALQGAIQGGIKGGITGKAKTSQEMTAVGGSLGMGKGSQYQKDKMAHLRSLRGSVGGSFRGSGAGVVSAGPRPMSFRGSGFYGSSVAPNPLAFRKRGLRKENFVFELGDKHY